jgi:hypothetical protein
VTDRSRKLASKSLSATSASERQQKYRASRKLASIDVSTNVRKSIQELRERLGEPTDAVLTQALALLADQQDREAAIADKANRTVQPVDHKGVAGPRRKSPTVRRINPEGTSPGDVARISVKPDRGKQQARPKPRAKRVDNGPTLPGLLPDE